MDKKNVCVAIDGPAGAGKSTIARAAASRLGLRHIDTGAMYRAAALEAVRRGIFLDDGPALGEMMADLDLRIEFADGVQRVYLGDEDVSEAIRTPEMSAASSRVSARPEVREALVRLQRELAKRGGSVMDGRDICTHVLPDADVKIFLTASPEVRAKRRLDELIEKGENASFEEVLADMKRRDYNDSHREHSPLVRAPEATLIDTSAMALDEAIEAVLSCIKEEA